MGCCVPRFSARSLKELNTCHNDLQVLFKTVVHHYDCSVLCGFRDETAQNMAYNGGRSKLKWPDSKHNKKPSMAVDVVPYPVDWNNFNEFHHFAGYVKGVAEMLHYEGLMIHRLRWGGNFEGMFDGPHYELIGV